MSGTCEAKSMELDLTGEKGSKGDGAVLEPSTHAVQL